MIEDLLLPWLIAAAAIYTHLTAARVALRARASYLEGSVIKPTVGRVVWFYSNGKSDMGAGVQPMAAIVARVHGDRCVNLAAFDPNGIPFQQTSVPLVQEGDELPQHACCVWMPYQKGQAAKAEAVEKQLAEAGKPAQ